ncbi:hypothetical protein ACHQM5_026220 [Ranunculus cassubicifolius]
MEDGSITIERRNFTSKQQFYSIDFFNKSFTTTVTSTPSVVRKWIYDTLHLKRYYLHRLVVGLGVQWNPNTSDPASTLQLCVGNRCLIFQLSHANYVPNILRRFLNDSRFTFVGIWNNSDGDRLRRSDFQLKLGKDAIDLRYIAAERYDDRSLKSASMEGLVSRVLRFDGVKKDNDVGRSNWDVYWLTEEQVLYAAVDAYVSFQMGKEMSVWNSNESMTDSGSDSDSVQKCYYVGGIFLCENGISKSA